MKVAARRSLIALLVFCVPQLASAVDLAGRFGFGVSNIGGSLAPSIEITESTAATNVNVASTGAGSLPTSLSLDWHVTNASAFEFDLGINTDGANNLLLMGTRYFRHVYLEDNAIFSAVLGGGLLSQQVSGESKSGYFLELGAGAKYFLPGAPNIGLGFLATLGVKSAGGVSFFTKALFSAHYYF